MIYILLDSIHPPSKTHPHEGGLCLHELVQLDLHPRLPEEAVARPAEEAPLQVRKSVYFVWRNCVWVGVYVSVS